MALAYSRAAILALALAAVGLTGLTLSPAIALAAPSEIDRAKARALMDEGDRRVEQGDHAAALVAFREADDIMAVPTTRIEVARTLAALGKLVEARDVALAVTRIPVQAGEARVFAVARKDAANLARDLEQRIPSLRIDIDGLEDANRARVRLDGTELSPATLTAPHKLDPGSHTVVVSAPGYASQTRTVTLAEGTERTLDVALVPVRQTEPARVRIPAAPVTADTGTDDGVSPLVFVGFGVGAAGLVVGGVAGAMSLTNAEEAKTLCRNNQCPPEAADDIEASRNWGTVSTVGFAVGAVGIGVGLVALVTSGRSEPTPQHVGVQPIVSPRWTGIRGRF